MKWKYEYAADADAVNANGTMALHLAAGFGTADMVKLLLTVTTKIRVNKRKWTPLHYVARFSLNTSKFTLFSVVFVTPIFWLDRPKTCYKKW